MNMERTTISDLASDYALGLAEGAELERAERLLATDAGFARQVADLQDKLHEINDTAMPAVPPLDLFARIEKGISGQDRVVRAVDAAPRAPLWLNLSFWRNFGLASATCLALGIGVITMAERSPARPVYVAVLQDGAGLAAAVVNAFADGTVMLVPITRIDVPQGRIIEVWTLQDRAQGPVSIGRMDQAQTLKLDLKTLPKAGLNHLFELTLEPAGGSPTGKPTGPILAKGLAAQSL